MIDAQSLLSDVLPPPGGLPALRIRGDQRAGDVHGAGRDPHIDLRAPDADEQALLAAERALGRDPTEMPHNNEGYDIETRAGDGRLLFIEVKGRVAGADRFTSRSPTGSSTTA